MKFRIFFRSFNQDLIKATTHKFQQILSGAECESSGVIALPLKIKRFCVIRSPHIDKDSREHLEIRMWKRFFDIETTSFSVLDVILQAEVPSGVACSLKILSVE